MNVSDERRYLYRLEEYPFDPQEGNFDGDAFPNIQDPDSDNDGIPDGVDRAPLDPNGNRDSDLDFIADRNDPYFLKIRNCKFIQVGLVVNNS